MFDIQIMMKLIRDKTISYCNDVFLIIHFQVLHPICSTLRVFDIADTSVTNYGLLTILRKMPQLHSLGEFCISDNFLRSLCVVTSLKVINNLFVKFPRKLLHVI